MRAVATGSAAFKRTAAGTGTDYALRRSIHRMEKGIISRPRRDVFATDYVESTVEHFVEGVHGSGSRIEEGSEIAWARDVLGQYFAIVGSSPEIDRARRRFGATMSASPQGLSTGLTPYSRELGEEPPVTYDALLKLAIRRRSVRWFEPQAVPRQLIDAAVAVAAQAPSACNRQPFEFRIYDHPDQVRRVASAPGGAAGFEHNFPVVVAVVGTLSAFVSDRDRHLIYIDGSLAAMSFMLALETLGLSSCPVNTPGVEAVEERLSHVLGLAAYERPVMLIAVGYPDVTGLVPRSQKKRIEDLRRYPA